MKLSEISTRQKFGGGILSLIAIAWTILDGYQLVTHQLGQTIPFLGPAAMLAMVGMGAFVALRE